MQTARDLLELQQVDLGIMRDRKAIEAIPEMAQIQEVRAKQKELARRTTKIVGMLKDQDIEAEDNLGRRATLTRHVAEVELDNSQTDDFRRVQQNNSQLDNLAKRLEKVDFRQKQIKAEAARLQEALDRARQIKASLDEREAALVESLRISAQGLKDELDSLTARREALLERIPEDVAERYRQSCSRHGGIGVAKLAGATCSGCRVELQQAQLDQLRRGPDIAACPVCGRILVVREQGGEG